VSTPVLAAGMQAVAAGAFALAGHRLYRIKHGRKPAKPALDLSTLPLF
jgi:hypothetical protein